MDRKVKRVAGYCTPCLTSKRSLFTYVTLRFRSFMSPCPCSIRLMIITVWLNNTSQHDFAVKQVILMEITLSPKMISVSSFHIQLWRYSVFLVCTNVRCNAERCSHASLFIIQFYNFSCECLCAFDYVTCLAVILTFVEVMCSIPRCVKQTSL